MRAVGLIVVGMLLGCGPRQVCETISDCPMPPSAQPMPPEPEVTRSSCDWFPDPMRIYELRDTSEELTPAALVRGEPVDDAPVVFRLREVTINDDEHVDYHAERADEAGARLCDEYGQCHAGLYVGCDEGIAEILAPDMRLSIEVLDAGTSVHGVFWHDILVQKRGASVYDEAEELEAGRVPGHARLLRMSDARRYEEVEGARSDSAASCRAHAEASRWAEARRSCHVAAALSRLTSEAAELLALLANTYRELGNVEEARAQYDRSLDMRDDPDVRSSRDALGE